MVVQDIDKTFFSSDHHFGHENIIKLTKRPFSSVGEMDEELIGRWNETVPEDGTVIYVGDFSYRAASDPGEVFRKLNGKKHLVTGNHDSKKVIEMAWDSVRDTLRFHAVDHDGVDSRVHVYHYPLLEWDQFFRGGYHAFGHVHGKISKWGRCMDVGVDSNDFRPVSLRKFFETLKKHDNVAERKFRFGGLG